MKAQYSWEHRSPNKLKQIRRSEIDSIKNKDGNRYDFKANKTHKSNATSNVHEYIFFISSPTSNIYKNGGLLYEKRNKNIHTKMLPK